MRTLLILMVLSLSLSSFGQLGVHFADSNAIWKINYRWWPPSPFGYNGYAENSISGDTTINNLLYKKIVKISYDVFCTNIALTDPQYMGALREDTTNNKVMFIPSGHQTDTLLYDYNLQVGDTLPPGYNVTILGNELFVWSIDTIETNGIKRMRWNLEAEYYGQFASIIEGIGSTNGLLEEIYIFETDAYLRCYYQNDSLVFLNNLFVNECVMPTDTCLNVGIQEDNNPLNYSIIYSPNPVNKRLNVKFLDYNYEDYHLCFFNNLGEYIKSVKLKSSRQEINVENLSSGIYYLVIKQGDLIINKQKIIKK